ncbi:MAG: hypothetical protein GX879_05020, partial [Bacteroidales bacterium]|nr:hypothetical protein [Bacteroidales bacterium]
MEDEHKDIADFEEENIDESIIQPDEKQKPKKKRRKRRFLKIIIAFGIIIALFLFFLSSIAKWYIEKNGEDLIGRKVSIGQLNINYLKFSVKAKDFILYEEDAQNPFVSFDEFVVNMNPWRLLKNQYAFSEIKLVNPFVKIVSHEMGFNFDDIIEHFSSDDDVEIEIDEDIESTIMYLVKNFALLGGQVIYEDKIEKSITEIKNLNLTI